MKNSFIFIVLFFQAAFSQISIPQAAPEPFKWTAAASVDTCGANESFTISLRLAADTGSYVYKSSISVLPDSSCGLMLGNMEIPQVRNHFDKLAGKNEPVLVNNMTVAVPCTVSRCLSNSITLKILCTYQGCVRNMCFLPVTDSVSITLHVRNDGQTVNASSVNAPVSRAAGKGDPADVFSGGALMALLLAFLGGLLTCLTPCVYPLIPITISIFGAGGAKSRLGAFGLSCLYVAGISVMFSLLGFIISVTGRVFGQFMANPLVIGFIAVVFCAFGVSLMGAFNMQLPSGLQNKLSSITGKSRGRSKVFFMGLVAGIIAAPCTGPSLGAILTYIAASGGRWSGILMLLSFSMGLGFPFLLLGTFSGLIASRPKPGPWMDWVKSILGIAMFVMALYFLRNIIPTINHLMPSTPWQYVIMSVFTLAGLLIGAVHLSFHGASPAGILRKTIGCILVTAGVFALSGQIFIPTSAPANAAHDESGATHGAWVTDVYRGVDSCRISQTPAIIDFYADWCASCKELDIKTFSDSAVQKELSRFIRIRADFTKETTATKKLAREYSIRGLPVLEFYSSDGKRLDDKRITGFVNANELLEHLKTIR